MNRLCLVFLVGVLAGLLVGCSSESDLKSPVHFVIGVSHANLTEPWRLTMNTEIQEQAARHPELRLIVTDAADSAQRQIQDVLRLVDSGIDLLIISPVESRALTETIASVHKNIPVILLDRAVEGYDYSLYIGPDNERIGRMMGQYVAQVLGPRGGNVLEVLGRSGSPPVLDRSHGFRDAIAAYPHIHIVDTVVADWLRDEAQDAVAQVLRGTQQVDFVVAQNDAMALGAYRAAEEARRSNVRFVGVDGLPGHDGGIDLVKRQILAATFVCPTGGREALSYALDLLHKSPGIPKKIFLRPQILTDKAATSAIALKRPSNTRPIVLGFAQTGHESAWREANTESIQSAARAAGIKLDMRFADQQQSRQIEAIRAFIKEKVDVIALPPLVETGWDEVLREAKAAGIPVIFSDRTARLKDPNLVTTVLGGDFFEEGRRAARWMISKFPAPQPVNIVEIRGTDGATPAIDRAQGFREVLGDDQRFHILDSADGDFEKDAGKAVMKTFLQRWGSQIQVVFAHNDDMALGAVEAIHEFGLRPGSDIKLVSIDGVRAAFEAMIAGRLNCSVECSPLLGPQLMKAVRDYAQGKDLPLRIVTDEGVFPQESAHAALPHRRY